MYFLGIRNVEARECSKLEPLILMHFLQMKKMNVSTPLMTLTNNKVAISIINF